MKICFFGVGGVGGYFGTLVTQKFKNEHELFFVARGKHKEAIRSNGLTLKKSGGAEIITVSPKLCTDNTGDLPVCDVFVLSVKEYDLDNAVKAISKISGRDTIILPLLNGVEPGYCYSIAFMCIYRHAYRKPRNNQPERRKQ